MDLTVDQQPVATNTLILVNLPPDAFDHQGAAVKSMIQSRYGAHLVRLITLRAFGRMLGKAQIIYKDCFKKGFNKNAQLCLT